MAETTTSNGTIRCYPRRAPEVGPPLFDHGKIHFQAHDLGWLIAFVFAIISCVVSFWLINKHIQWYTNKKEQRYIVRILFMVPIYALISFASYLFWNHSTPLVLLRDCYESVVLTAFFYLLLTYISPNLEEQKEFFLTVGISRSNDLKRKRKGEPPRKWVLPLGFVKWKPADGLYFLQLMKWGVLQYCVIRPITTLAAVILGYVGLYCEDSWSPGWGHIYLTVILSLSVSVAMYCLIQMYVTIAEPLKPRKPLLKLFAIKAVVFLTFWQATFLSLLVTAGVVKDTKYMTANNINTGIGAIAECVEMTMFAFLHVKCFTYKVYLPEPTTFYGDISDQRTPRLRSLGHAMNFKETGRELWNGCVYMVRHMRGKETDKMIRRTVIMENAFGRSRITVHGAHKELPPAGKLDAAGVNIAVEETVHVGAERQWLGMGDNYGYGLGYITREKSEGLGEQIEKELGKRGYGTTGRIRDEASSHDADVEQGHLRGHRSWWRSIYDRISQSGPDDSPTPVSKRKSMSRPENVNSKSLMDHAYDDPPPMSPLRNYKDRIGSHPTDLQVNTDFTRPNLEIPLHDSPEDCPRIQPNSPQNIVAQNSELNSQTALSHLTRSDSLLARVFPYAQSNSAFIEGPASSSRSHRTHTRITAEPTLIPKISSLCKVPAVVETSNLNIDSETRGVSRPARGNEDRTHSRRSSHMRDSARYSPLLAPLPPASSSSESVNSNPARLRYSHPSSASRAKSPLFVVPNSSPTFHSHASQRLPPRTGSHPYQKNLRAAGVQLTIPSPLAPVSELGKCLSDGYSRASTSPPDVHIPSSTLSYPQTSQPPQQSYARSPASPRRTTSPLSSVSPVSPSRPHRSNAVRRGSLEPLRGLRKYPLEPPARAVYPQQDHSLR